MPMIICTSPISEAAVDTLSSIASIKVSKSIRSLHSSSVYPPWPATTAASCAWSVSA